MTDGIKGRTHVEEAEDCEKSRISCYKEVVGEFDEYVGVLWSGREPDWNCSSTCTNNSMKVRVVLGGYCFFQDFGDVG